MAADTKAHHN